MAERLCAKDLRSDTEGKTMTHASEVEQGQRFEFGRNWESFLRVLDEERITEAQESLRAWIGIDLRGKTFLDVGSGSGLSSLVAMRMGAARVHSFDFDPHSVACTRELKRRFYPDAAHWVIEEGSVLDPAYMEQLGQFDVVYAWGVLHHTGQLWNAMNNVAPRVATGGRLFIALYNNQGRASRVWLSVKRLYNKGGVGRAIVTSLYVPYFAVGGIAVDALHARNPLSRYREYKKLRGMSRVHDWFDWIGGLPFEVSTPEEVFEFYRDRGFDLEKLLVGRGAIRNNEFVFTRRKSEGDLPQRETS